VTTYIADLSFWAWQVTSQNTVQGKGKCKTGPFLSYWLSIFHSIFMPNILIKNRFAYFFLLILDLLDHAMSHFSMGSFTAELFLWWDMISKKCNYILLYYNQGMNHFFIKSLHVEIHLSCTNKKYFHLFQQFSSHWLWISIFLPFCTCSGDFYHYFTTCCGLVVNLIFIMVGVGGKFVENSFLTFRVKNL